VVALRQGHVQNLSLHEFLCRAVHRIFHRGEFLRRDESRCGRGHVHFHLRIGAFILSELLQMRNRPSGMKAATISKGAIPLFGGLIMAFFSADEYDQTALGNPWNAAAILLLSLTAIACLLWMAQPASGPLAPYPGPNFGYNSSP